MQNYQVAVSNGNEKMKYYLSAGYLDEKGILDISYYKRYNFRVNLENQIRSWLTVSANISYSDYTSNGGGAMEQERIAVALYWLLSIRRHMLRSGML